MDEIRERRRARRSSSRSDNPFGCLGCLGSVILMMGLSGAVIWALNPGMSGEDAARQGILVGGGLSVAASIFACGVPLLLIGAAFAFVFVMRRRARNKADGPIIIDTVVDD